MHQSIFSKNWGLGNNSKIFKANPYRVISLFKVSMTNTNSANEKVSNSILSKMVAI